MLEVIPLGTGSALPSRTNHFSATAVETAQSLFLFDCGEGTQHQMLQASLRWSRLKAICITHLHGDHYFGLPGLLSTLSLLQHNKPLVLVGPAGLKSFIKSLPSRNPNEQHAFPIQYVELENETALREIFASDECRMLAHPIEHSIPAFGFRLEEADTPGNLNVEKAKALGLDDFEDYRRLKNGEHVQLADGSRLNPEEVVTSPKRGAVFAYITDTRPCKGSVDLARNADLVYHEATFMHDELERAIVTHHSTTLEAAQVASDAGVKRLLIGHFSGRYKAHQQLVREAQNTFKNTEAAEELKRYTLTGGEQLTMEAAQIKRRNPDEN